MVRNPADGITRRGIVGSVGAGAAIVTLASLNPAQAALLPEPQSKTTTDLVVIGSGLSGCVAALEAVSRGARVIVLEKAPENRAGGNSLLAGGGFAMPKEASEAARQAFVEDSAAVCRNRGNAEIFRLMADHVLDDVAWLTENGATVMPPMDWPPHRVSIAFAAPGMFQGMPRLLRTLRDQIVAKGGAFAFETKAHQLIMNDRGAVAGVRAVGRDGVADYLAKSVVIAAGGYAANPQILEAYSDPNAGALMVRGIDWATGDGLTLGQQAGAGLRGMGGIMALHIAAVDPVETAAGNPAAALPYCLSINRDGLRFIDESLGYVAHGKAVLGQPGQSVALIFDEAIKAISGPATAYATFQRLGMPVVEADTLEELATRIRVPTEPFLRTVRDFNAAVVGDAAINAAPPKAALAHKIETPKFYAFSPLVPGVTLTFGGLMINTKAQVLEADGRIIPGLFAAGEGAGHVFFHDYIGGSSMTNCLVMGRIAGQQALA